MQHVFDDWPLTENEAEAVDILIALNEQGRISDDEFEDRLVRVLGPEKEAALWEWATARTTRWDRIKTRLGSSRLTREIRKR